MLIAIVTFVVVLGIVFGAYWVAILRPEDAGKRKLRRRMRVGAGPKGAAPDLLVKETPLSSVGSLDRALRGADTLTGPLQTQIERSGLSVSVGVVVLASVFLATVAFAGLLLTTRLVSVALVVGLCLLFVPYMIIRYLAARRLEKFEEQFPEGIDLIARALRAGHAFTTGLGMAAEELAEPAGTEFRLVHDRQNFGMPLPDALKEMARRVPLLDARFFVTAVLTQRESGGNLAEVLDNLASLMRERFRVRRQVRTVSAHGRITGWVLTFLAPAIAAILIVIAPAHMALMVQDPLGVRMIVGAMVLQIIGVLTIRRIIDIEV